MMFHLNKSTIRVVCILCGCFNLGESLNRQRLFEACRPEDGYFDCGNGICIFRVLVRDTANHCGNEADELNAQRNCSNDEVTCRVTSRCVQRTFINTVNSCTVNQQMILPCRKYEEFTCVESRKCIERWKVMNGFNDCGTMLIPNDTSDEVMSLDFCTNREFACHSWLGHPICIPREWVRDGISDCHDGLDESTVLLCDETYEFRCRADGRCVDRYRVKDDFNDCIDGSDEIHPISCLQTEFTCADTGRCLPVSWRKNGVLNCHDGSDELDIPENVTCQGTDFRCPSTHRCIPRSYLCDGIDHCGDCTDEIETCEEPVMLRCPNDLTTCIHWSYACDPYADCPNVEDDVITTGPGFKCERNYLGFPHTARYCVIPQWSLRDSYFTCDDRSDLCFENGTFHCSLCLDRKTIIAPRQMCDGVFDCPDLSDECLCVVTADLATEQLCKNVCYNSPSESCFLCNKGEFHCDGICLPTTAICNGSIDCYSSKIDEAYCTIETKSMESNKEHDFVCDPIPEHLKLFLESGNFVNLASQMFPISAIRCDGHIECRNMEDECSPQANCTKRPTVCDDIPLITEKIPSGFVGSSQEVIEIRRCEGMLNFAFGFSICNGIRECEDGIDETDCPDRFYCDAGQVEWLTGKKDQVSIKKSKVCDAKYPPDCLDGSDESNCSAESHFYCDGGSPLFVRENQVLDGVQDCDDYSDECPEEIFQNNALTSREELIRYSFLNAMVWVMAVIAIFGNSAVFFVSYNSLRSKWKKARIAQGSAIATINKLLILNLSIADFLMGIALLIIASKSAEFSGAYCLADKVWRSSTMCNAVGVLSVVSSQASVLTLVCLTSYRLYAVYFPMKTRVLSKRLVGCWIICIWTLCFIVALVPLSDGLSRGMIKSMLIHPNAYLAQNTIKFDDLLTFTQRLAGLQTNETFDETTNLNTWVYLEQHLNRNFPDYAPKKLGYFGYYSASAVCLPRYFKLNTDVTSLNPMSPVVISFNFIALVYICAAYIAIYKRSSVSCKIEEQRQSEHRQKLTRKMQRKISILILTDLACWLPVCLMTFISLGTSGLPDIVYAISAIILLPINSSLNPLIYTDALTKLYSTARDLTLWFRSQWAKLKICRNTTTQA